jgi:hypothetical protein
MSPSFVPPESEPVRKVTRRTDRSEIEAESVARRLSARGVPGSMPPDGVLSEADRAWAEPAFGFDFSRVRLRSDPAAAEFARGVGARAVTSGRNILWDGARPGPSTLAHELAHVVQQATTVPRAVAGQTLSPAPGLLQRQAVPDDERLEKAVDALAASIDTREIEADWAEIRALAQSDVTRRWAGVGDSVLSLIREHAALAASAVRAGDGELVSTLRTVIEGEVVAWGFVAWHVVVGAQLDALAPDMADLITSFDADETEYTGRESAEAVVRGLFDLATVFPVQGDEALARLRQFRVVLDIGSGRSRLLRVTSAINVPDLQYFISQSLELAAVSQEIKVGLGATGEFLSGAFAEGLETAVMLYLEHRPASRGGRGQPKLGPKKNNGPSGKGKGKGKGQGQGQGQQDRKKFDKNKNKNKGKGKDKESGKRRKPWWWNASMTYSLAVKTGGIPGTLDTRSPLGAKAPLHGHHVWPEYAGGHPDQPLMSVRDTVHLGDLHRMLDGFIAVTSTALGHRATRNGDNYAFVREMRRSPTKRAAFAGSLLGFYRALNLRTDPPIPAAAYAPGVTYAAAKL